jgi:asparagine synthase (glutamine-hydrolysing)
MCGIVGFSGVPDGHLWLRRMNDSQTHRGPDDDGVFYCHMNTVYLAMKRLSIVDMEHGSQPMSINNGKIWIIFNGEIFNAPQLRKEIECKGRHLKSDHSDTEILPHLYELYGRDMLKKLNGMFAFVIYDVDNRKLFCARDPFGIKPFYYSVLGDKFGFASELKSLRILPWVSKDLNSQGIFDFFSFQCIPSPNSVIDSVYKLPPAHWLEWDLKTFRKTIDSYWSPTFSDSLPCQEEDLPEYVRFEFQAAVKRWSISDVPLACALSGGLDSSAIVACLSREFSQPLKTYSLGFGAHPTLDERHTAKHVADLFDTEHHEIVVNSSDLLESIDQMLYCLDEPYGGGLPSWFVFREMSKSVKVGMTGVGGDELFGSYGKWLPYEKAFYRLKRYASYLASGGSVKHLLQYRKSTLYHPMYFPDEFKQNSLFEPSFLESVDMLSVSAIQNDWDDLLGPRDSIMKLDFLRQLPDEFLFMTDRFSMAHSLEARTPFLDIDFVRCMTSIPSPYRTRKGDFKFLLKLAFEKLLPDQVLSSSKKGFVLPMCEWLRGPLRDDLLLFSDRAFLQKQRIFREDIFDVFVQPFLECRKNNFNQVWTWWSFQRWWALHQSY